MPFRASTAVVCHTVSVMTGCYTLLYRVGDNISRIRKTPETDPQLTAQLKVLCGVWALKFPSSVLPPRTRVGCVDWRWSLRPCSHAGSGLRAAASSGARAGPAPTARSC